MADIDDNTIKELLPMLSTKARYDLKFLAMQHFQGLSGTVAGRELIISKPIFIERVVELACDNVTNVVKDAIACLINVASDDRGASKTLQVPNITLFLDNLLSSVVESGCLLGDAIAMLLSNLSRIESGAELIVNIITGDDPPTTLDRIVQVMCLNNYNQHAELHFLSSLLSNLSIISSVRKHFLDKEKSVIQRFLSFTQHPSEIRRRGVASVLKNCTFETEYHDWLLSPSVDIVPALLLPLAGPEEFDEDDTEKLPLDLQYLPDDKTREIIPEIRKMHVEALTQLCATAGGRKYMKDHRVYVIIREYHKSEKVEDNDTAILNLIDILIGDEPDADKIGTTNLKEIDIPEHYVEQFNEEDKQETVELQANGEQIGDK